jgi:hypothetical protein
VSVSLASMVAKLQLAVAARGGVPSSSQYQQCVEDAVADLSERKPNQKVTILSIVSGTGSYALPSDFLRPIVIEQLTSTDGVLISDAGLIPVDAEWKELYTYAGQTLTITPTPTYTASRRLWYAAGHVLDGSSNYPDLTAIEARAALLLAQSLALGLQANVASQTEGWKYQIGDEMVDKTGMQKGMTSQAQALEKQYLAAVEKLVGPFGVRG